MKNRNVKNLQFSEITKDLKDPAKYFVATLANIF